MRRTSVLAALGALMILGACGTDGSSGTGGQDGGVDGAPPLQETEASLSAAPMAPSLALLGLGEALAAALSNEHVARFLELRDLPHLKTARELVCGERLGSRPWITLVCEEEGDILGIVLSHLNPCHTAGGEEFGRSGTLGIARERDGDGRIALTFTDWRHGPLVLSGRVLLDPGAEDGLAVTAPELVVERAEQRGGVLARLVIDDEDGVVVSTEPETMRVDLGAVAPLSLVEDGEGRAFSLAPSGLGWGTSQGCVLPVSGHVDFESLDGSFRDRSGAPVDSRLRVEFTPGEDGGPCAEVAVSFEPAFDGSAELVANWKERLEGWAQGDSSALADASDSQAPVNPYAEDWSAALAVMPAVVSARFKWTWPQNGVGPVHRECQGNIEEDLDECWLTVDHGAWPATGQAYAGANLAERCLASSDDDECPGEYEPPETFWKSSCWSRDEPTEGQKFTFPEILANATTLRFRLTMRETDGDGFFHPYLKVRLLDRVFRENPAEGEKKFDDRLRAETQISPSDGILSCGDHCQEVTVPVTLQFPSGIDWGDVYLNITQIPNAKKGLSRAKQTYTITDMQVLCDPRAEETPAILRDWRIPRDRIIVSHVGYQPDSEKFALVDVGLFEGQPRPWPLEIKDELGETVPGEFTCEPSPVPYGGEEHLAASCDFTTLRRPGVFTLEFAGLTSRQFAISEDVYRCVLDTGQGFLENVRCGAETHWHAACHRDDGYYDEEATPETCACDLTDDSIGSTDCLPACAMVPGNSGAGDLWSPFAQLHRNYCYQHWLACIDPCIAGCPVDTAGGRACIEACRDDSVCEAAKTDCLDVQPEQVGSLWHQLRDRLKRHDFRGGYHDAGDLRKYLGTAAHVLTDLALAASRLEELPDEAQLALVTELAWAIGFVENLEIATKDPGPPQFVAYANASYFTDNAVLDEDPDEETEPPEVWPETDDRVINWVNNGKRSEPTALEIGEDLYHQDIVQGLSAYLNVLERAEERDSGLAAGIGAQARSSVNSAAADRTYALDAEEARTLLFRIIPGEPLAAVHGSKLLSEFAKDWPNLCPGVEDCDEYGIVVDRCPLLCPTGGDCAAAATVSIPGVKYVDDPKLYPGLAMVALELFQYHERRGDFDQAGYWLWAAVSSLNALTYFQHELGPDRGERGDESNWVVIPRLEEWATVRDVPARIRAAWALGHQILGPLVEGAASAPWARAAAERLGAGLDTATLEGFEEFEEYLEDSRDAWEDALESWLAGWLDKTEDLTAPYCTAPDSLVFFPDHIDGDARPWRFRSPLRLTQIGWQPFPDGRLPPNSHDFQEIDPRTVWLTLECEDGPCPDADTLDEQAAACPFTVTRHLYDVHPDTEGATPVASFQLVWEKDGDKCPMRVKSPPVYENDDHTLNRDRAVLLPRAPLSSTVQANTILAAMMAARALGNDEFRRHAEANLQFLLGFNSADVTFVRGLGYRDVPVYAPSYGTPHGGMYWGLPASVHDTPYILPNSGLWNHPLAADPGILETKTELLTHTVGTFTAAVSFFVKRPSEPEADVR